VSPFLQNAKNPSLQLFLLSLVFEERESEREKEKKRAAVAAI
jgi:hypothetical protein